MSPMTVSRIGRYEIKALVGAGGMGSVYLARDTNPNTNRLVTVKVLNANLESGDLRERFARESRALATLSHPNIVNIYDSGEFQGAPYIVMEFVRGETLAEKIKRRAPLTMSEKLKMMAELCEGLAHAHEAGIVHRDIKPANLMVDQHGRLRILDFGIARVAEGSMTRVSAPVTQFNMRIGTPGYMSPEQIEGGEVDRRTDLFAAGVVFYELLSYREAFSGGSTRQIENKILQSEPPPLTSLVPGLDPEIAAIVAHALEKDPAKRYQDAESFEQALDHQRWRLGPERRTPSPARSTPTPTPTPGRAGHQARADAAYQRSLAAYGNGAVEAARRSALEAIAEDQNHPGAAALLDKLDPSFRSFRASLVEPTAVEVEPTQVASRSSDDATVVRAALPPSPPAGRREQPRTWWDLGRWRQMRADPRYFWPAVAVGGLVLLVGAGVIAFRLLAGPSGQALTIVKPTGGSILGRGITCGTLGSDCTVTRPSGEVVELQAQPDEGFLFAGYTGDCEQGGRTMMNGARTCGARFDPIPAAPPAALRLLTILPPQGGTIVAMGITCGTGHSECATTFPHGTEVKLDVLADAGFEFAKYTGPCAPDGGVVMTEARTCSAQFTRKVTVARTPPSPVTGGDSAPRVPRTTVRVSEDPPPAPVGGGLGRADEASAATTGTTNPGGLPTGPGGLPTGTTPRTPPMIAKDAIRKTLNAYRDAYGRMDEDGIRKVFPSVPSDIREQLRQFKSVEFVFTGEPEYTDLDLPAGTAKIEIAVKRVFEAKVGGPQKPIENHATVSLRRLGPDSDEWRIEGVRYHK